MELGVKFYFCDRFVIDSQQLSQASRVTHSLLHFMDDLEASGAENGDSYSDISISSVHTCDLTDFDGDSPDSDSDRCA